MTRGRGGGAEGGVWVIEREGGGEGGCVIKTKGGSEEREVGLLGLEITGE